MSVLINFMSSWFSQAAATLSLSLSCLFTSPFWFHPGTSITFIFLFVSSLFDPNAYFVVRKVRQVFLQSRSVPRLDPEKAQRVATEC